MFFSLKKLNKTRIFFIIFSVKNNGLYQYNL